MAIGEDDIDQIERVLNEPDSEVLGQAAEDRAHKLHQVRAYQRGQPPVVLQWLFYYGIM